MSIATYDIVGGTTHTPLPKYIQSKNATVNIKNKDDKTLLYCLSYVRKPVVEHAQRASHYTKELNNFEISGIKFPVKWNQIAKFEQQNPDFSVNVFKLDKKKEITLIPLYMTPERQREVSREFATDRKQPETALCRHQQHESSSIQTNTRSK